MGHDIRLLRLQLDHFKREVSRVFEPLARSAEIRGDNGTGKTTLLDAWTWLLTGKASAGRQDCSVKTLGHEKADHSVTALVDVDGREVELRRSYKEVWRKKRGTQTRELQGHKTTYQIDGEPLKQREWESRLAELLPDHTWLLTVPGAFAALHWQDCRGILVELTGEVSMADVVASNSALKDLPEILGPRTVDGHRKAANAGRKAANAKLEQIPARIDEVSRQLAPLDALDREALTASLADAEAKLAELRAGIDEGPLRQRAALQTQRTELAGQLDAETRTAERRQRQAIREAEQDLRVAKAAHKASIEAADADDAAAKEAEDSRQKLLAEYHQVRAQRPDVPGTCTCRDCGHTHAVSPERVAEVRANANRAKATRLSKIVERGQRAKAEAADLRHTAEGHRLDAERHEAEIVAVTNALAKAKAPPPESPLVAQLAPGDAVLAALVVATPAPPDTSEVEAEAKRLRADLARLDGADGLRKRIAELEAEQKEAAAQLERRERELYLLDLYASTLAELTEERVNGLFETVTFRLWEEQLNGGVQQTCTMLVDGVPVGGGLNHGASINAGLDIIRVLRTHWGCSVPVWIDSAAEVTRPLDIGGQVFRLVADIKCEELEVSYE